MRENYHNIDKINGEAIKNYLKSPVGKKHTEEYIDFYRLTSKIYGSKNRLEYCFRLLIYGSYLAVFNYYGRRKINLKIYGL